MRPVLTKFGEGSVDEGETKIEKLMILNIMAINNGKNWEN